MVEKCGCWSLLRTLAMPQGPQRRSRCTSQPAPQLCLAKKGLQPSLRMQRDPLAGDTRFHQIFLLCLLLEFIRPLHGENSRNHPPRQGFLSHPAGEPPMEFHHLTERNPYLYTRGKSTPVGGSRTKHSQLRGSKLAYVCALATRQRFLEIPPGIHVRQPWHPKGRTVPAWQRQPGGAGPAGRWQRGAAAEGTGAPGRSRPAAGSSCQTGQPLPAPLKGLAERSRPRRGAGSARAAHGEGWRPPSRHGRRARPASRAGQRGRSGAAARLRWPQCPLCRQLLGEGIP